MLFCSEIGQGLTECTITGLVLDQLQYNNILLDVSSAESSQDFTLKFSSTTAFCNFIKIWSVEATVFKTKMFFQTFDDLSDPAI